MTTTNIGALSVEINADSSQLKRGIKEAQGSLQNARKSLNDNAAQFAKWGAAGVAAAGAVGAAIFKITASNVRELKNLSFAANTLTEDFQRGAFAAQEFGISQEKYGDILKDVNDRVGDFLVTGGGPMVDFFEQIAPKVGITADAFRGLSGQDALGLFVKSLEEANVSQQEMTFYMEAMASDATQLIPLFENNAEALSKMTDEAKALGIGLSEIEVTKIEQASKALDAAGASTEALIQEVVAELAPLVTAVANMFQDATTSTDGFRNEIELASDVAINSIGFVLDAVEGVERTFQVLGRTVATVVLGIQEGMLTAADFIVNRPIEAVNELIDALNSLPWHNIDPVKLTGFGDTIKAELGVVRGAIDLAVDDIQDILTAPMPSEALKAAVEEAKTQARELAEVTAEARKTAGLDAGSVSAPKISDDTQAILDRFKTEEQLLAEKLATEEQMIAESLKNREITQQEHDRAIQNLQIANAQQLQSLKQDAFNQETAALISNMQSRFQSESDLMAEKYAADQEALNIARETGNVSDVEHYMLAEQLRQEHQDRLAQINSQARQAELAATSDLFGALASAMSAGGKKNEKVVRALSVAQAGIKAGSAAISAYEAGMAVGGPAAPLTAAKYAAASIAQTGIMISRLKSGSKAPASPSGVLPSNAGNISQGAAGAPQTGTQQRIDINISGQAFFSSDQVRQLIEQINEQTSDGVQLNANLGA